MCDFIDIKCCCYCCSDCFRLYKFVLFVTGLMVMRILLLLAGWLADWLWWHWWLAGHSQAAICFVHRCPSVFVCRAVADVVAVVSFSFFPALFWARSFFEIHFLTLLFSLPFLVHSCPLHVSTLQFVRYSLCHSHSLKPVCHRYCCCCCFWHCCCCFGLFVFIEICEHLH